MRKGRFPTSKRKSRMKEIEAARTGKERPAATGDSATLSQKTEKKVMEADQHPPSVDV